MKRPGEYGLTVAEGATNIIVFAISQVPGTGRGQHSGKFLHRITNANRSYFL